MINDSWIRTNNVNENIDYISNLLIFNEIENWMKSINTNDNFNNYDLFFKFKDKNYKIKVDEGRLALKLLEENDKENYHKSIYCVNKNIGDKGNFYGEDCWYNLFKCIVGE